ncbi:MAG: hypothetical protein GXY91_01560 [Clostridia bacterium]|nr:hypothetical protein [Clostridia bacterium]
MIGDVFVIDETPIPFNQYPRAVANAAEEYMKSTGIADEMRIGPEFEFYVFDHVSYEIKPNLSRFRIDAEQAEWNSGNEEQNLGYKVPLKEGYHMTPPMDVLYNLRSEICMLLEERNVPVKYHHHEVGGPGQLAGLDGIEQKLDPTELGYGPYDINLYNLPKEEQAKIKPLPFSLEQALDALEKDHDFLLKGGVFPKRLIEIWLERKREEVKKFNQYPHPMEFALYYDL